MLYLARVPARPTLSSASHAWQKSTLDLLRAQATSSNYLRISPLRRTTGGTVIKHGHESSFENEPNIYPESLRQTLDAHRDANRASLIHKISEDGKRLSLLLGTSVTETPQTVYREEVEPAIHLKFARAKRQRGKRGRADETNAEYTGESWGLTAQWRNAGSAPLSKRLPWVRELSAASGPPFKDGWSALERLTSEILAFHEYILPKPDELAAADQAITALRSFVNSIDASVEVDLIGSRRTGLATPLSDLDFNLTSPNGGNSTGDSQEREQAHELLRSLWAKLPKRGSIVQGSSFVDGARVPIITGLHGPTNLKFQIQCTGDVFNSMRYAQAYVAEYPTLRPLYMVLRQMLEIRGLNVGRLGGIGSYPLLIMIVAALKLSETQIGRRDAGKQFCFFLSLYSKVDFYSTAVSLAPPGFILKGTRKGKRLSQQPTLVSPDRETVVHALEELSEDDLEGRKWFSHARPEPHLMCLQDPSNLGHDLGKQVKLIKHIQAVLMEADSNLRRGMHTWDTTDWTRSTGMRTNFALLDWCLGADHEIFEDERILLSAVGQRHSQADPVQTIWRG